MKWHPCSWNGPDCSSFCDHFRLPGDNDVITKGTGQPHLRRTDPTQFPSYCPSWLLHFPPQILFQFEQSLSISNVTVNTPLWDRKSGKSLCHQCVFSDFWWDKDSEQFGSGLSLSQVDGGVKLGGKKMRVQDDGFSHWHLCCNAQNTLFTAPLGCESALIAAGWGQSWKGSRTQLTFKKNPKHTHKSFSLPVDKITDWHAKPIKYVFCKFWNEEKCYVKIFTDAEWL